MRTKNIFITAIFSIIAIFASMQTPVAHASATDNVFGYAWSSTIGWISFNNCTSTDASSCSGTDYGVSMDTNGKFSGYAWSDNIGYINFDGVSTSGGNLIGDAQACSVYTSGCSGALKDNLYRGDWDGKIKLNPNYGGVKISGNSITGFAWGSDVVGWAEFNLTVGDQAPSVNLLVNGQQGVTIKSGDSVKLTWDSTGVTSCTSDDFSVGTGDTTKNSSGVMKGPINGAANASYTYFIKCTNGSKLATDSVTVTIEGTTPPPGGTTGCTDTKIINALFGITGTKGTSVKADVQTYVDTDEDFDVLASSFSSITNRSDFNTGKEVLNIEYTYTDNSGTTPKKVSMTGANGRWYKSGTTVSINKGNLCFVTPTNDPNHGKIKFIEN